MGCFSIPHERKAKNRASSSSPLPYPQGISHPKQGTPPLSHASSRNDSGRNLQPTTPPRASSPHSASSKLMRQHSEASLGASSSLRKPPSFHKENPHSIEGRSDQFSSYGHTEERHFTFFSAPISCQPMDAEQGISNLFPLPLPPSVPQATICTPTDDSSSQSVSSVGSGSSSCSSASSSSCSASTGSINSKSYNSTQNSPSTAESLPLLQTCNVSTSRALPLPPPPDCGVVLREFSYDELAGACLNFATEFFIREGGAGTVFKAILKHEPKQEDRIEVAVTRLSRASLHSFRKWRVEVASLARLSHPHLCKVLGFSGEDSSRPPDKAGGFQRERLLVYEHTSNGSLESLLYCRKGKAPLDWAARVKIAMGAAQGLAYLHDRIPRQIIYKSFKTINVQVDQNFNAKLSDYGFARTCKELPSSSPLRLSPVDDAYMAPETRISDDLSTKSNVWSFGIILLELITGRQNMDDFFPVEERNLLQWCRPHLLDSKRLYLIMDPELKGRYPTRTAKMLADLALQCLSEDPVVRPSMRDVANTICSHVNQCNVGDAKIDYAPIINNHHTYCINHANRSGKISNGGSNYSNYGSRFKLSKSYNLASVLASPARAFGVSAHIQDHPGMHAHTQNQSRTKLREFLSGEITKEASLSLAGSTTDHPFLSSYGFLLGEIGVQSTSGIDSKSPISKDYLPPPLGRTLSSSSHLTPVTG